MVVCSAFGIIIGRTGTTEQPLGEVNCKMSKIIKLFVMLACVFLGSALYYASINRSSSGAYDDLCLGRLDRIGQSIVLYERQTGESPVKKYGEELLTELVRLGYIEETDTIDPNTEKRFSVCPDAEALIVTKNYWLERKKISGVIPYVVKHHEFILKADGSVTPPAPYARSSSQQRR